MERKKTRMTTFSGAQSARVAYQESRRPMNDFRNSQKFADSKSKESALNRRETLAENSQDAAPIIHELKTSFPLLKIDFEKIEIELEVLKGNRKKQSKRGNFQTKDIPASGRIISPNKTSSRGSSTLRRAETQIGCLDQILVIENCMNNFKSNFFQREQLVLALINKTTDKQHFIQKIIESQKGADIELFTQRELPFEIAENTLMLQRRVQELQKINNDLLSELRLANRKLLDSKYLTQQFSSREFARPYCKTASNLDQYDDSREYFLNSEEDHIAEDKMTHRDKLCQFDLAKTSWKDQKIIDMHKVLSQRVEYYFAKLKVTSICVNRFLSAMQKLQWAVQKKDQKTMVKMKGDFELNKSQLLALAKELKVFELSDAMSYSLPANSPAKLYHFRTQSKPEVCQHLQEKEKLFKEEKETLLQQIEKLDTNSERDTPEKFTLREAKIKLIKDHQTLESQLTQNKEISMNIRENLLQKTRNRFEEVIKQKDKEILQLKNTNKNFSGDFKKIKQLFDDQEITNLQFKIIQEIIEEKIKLMDEMKEKIDKFKSYMRKEVFLALQEEQSNTLMKTKKIEELELELNKMQQRASNQEKEAQSNIEKYQKVIANKEKQLQLKNTAYDNLENSDKIKFKDLEDRLNGLQDQVMHESLARNTELQKCRKLEEEKANLHSQNRKIQHVLDVEKKKQTEEQVLEFNRRKRKREGFSIPKILQSNIQVFYTKFLGNITTQISKVNNLQTKLNQIKTKLIKSKLITTKEIEKNHKFEIDTKNQLDLYEESIAENNSENEVLHLQITELELIIILFIPCIKGLDKL